jgi:hypothetical protein
MVGKMTIARMLILWGLIIISLPVLAKDNTLYRWQDEQGQWHFGDAVDATAKPKVEQVKIAPESANFIKTKIVKVPSSKIVKAPRESKSKNNLKQAGAVSLNQKKQNCDKLRDDLRFKAFRSAERDTYDHECVSAVKW